MIFFSLNYNQLLLHGVHVGHSLSNTLLYSTWMVSALRQSITIINLFKSLIMFRISFLLLTNIIALHGPIWFINLDKSVDRYVRYAASNCGEFSITSYWIKGSISNYRTIFNAQRNLSRLSKTILSAKKQKFSKYFERWFLTRYSWPRLVFISNLNFSYLPVKEAMSSKIPNISIVDTNSWTQATTIAIPGNDESLGCIIFYNDMISNFILSRKFNLVSAWYFNIRSISRIVSFSDWLRKKYKLVNTKNLKNLITLNPSFLNNYLKSFGLFMFKNNDKTTLIDRLYIFNKNKSSFNISKSASLFLSMRKVIILGMNLHFVKKFWLLKKFYKKWFFKEKRFKLKFLNRLFYAKKFLTRFYITSGLRINLKFLNHFIKGITDLFFLRKYLKVWVLPPLYTHKFKYWDIITKIFTDKAKRKSLWQKKFIKNSNFLPFWRKRYSAFNFKLTNKLILLSKIKYKNKLKFFVNYTNFNSALPKNFWVSDKKYFLFEKTALFRSVYYYFFKLSKNKVISYPFIGLLSKPVKKRFNLSTKSWIWR